MIRNLRVTVVLLTEYNETLSRDLLPGGGIRIWNSRPVVEGFGLPGRTHPAGLVVHFEGEGAPPISGMYKLVAVLQHMNPGPNESSGFAEGQVFLRTP